MLTVYFSVNFYTIFLTTVLVCNFTCTCTYLYFALLMIIMTVRFLFLKLPPQQSRSIEFGYDLRRTKPTSPSSHVDVVIAQVEHVPIFYLYFNIFFVVLIKLLLAVYLHFVLCLIYLFLLILCSVIVYDSHMSYSVILLIKRMYLPSVLYYLNT